MSGSTYLSMLKNLILKLTKRQKDTPIDADATTRDETLEKKRNDL